MKKRIQINKMQKSETLFYGMIAAIGIVILLAGYCRRQALLPCGGAQDLRRYGEVTLKTNAENTIIFLMRTMRKVL